MTTSFDSTTIAAALTTRAAEVAVALLGEPNRQISSKCELRFGRKGSLAVVTDGTKAGCWYDYKNGYGGDIIDLIERVRCVDFSDAIAYAEQFYGSISALPMSPQPAIPARSAGDDMRRKATPRRRFPCPLGHKRSLVLRRRRLESLRRQTPPNRQQKCPRYHRARVLGAGTLSKCPEGCVRARLRTRGVRNDSTHLRATISRHQRQIWNSRYRVPVVRASEALTLKSRPSRPAALVRLARFHLWAVWGGGLRARSRSA
jgi:hypothetical protein